MTEAVPLAASGSGPVGGGTLPPSSRRVGASPWPCDVTDRSRPNSSGNRSVECEADPLPLPVVGEAPGSCEDAAGPSTAFRALSLAATPPTPPRFAGSAGQEDPAAPPGAPLAVGCAPGTDGGAPPVAVGALAAGEAAIGGGPSRGCVPTTALWVTWPGGARGCAAVLGG